MITQPKYCSQRCHGVDKHNNKKGPTQNTFYKCKNCGKEVSTYRSPCAKRTYKAKFCSLKCIGNYQKGNRNPSWNGGRYKDANGYINIFKPYHPRANVKGYIYEHRIKMEKSIGRYLRQIEVVHHLDGNKENNKINNLKLFPNNSKHQKYHSMERRKRNGQRTDS